MDPARIVELLRPFLTPSPALEDLSFRAGFSPEESAGLAPSQLGQISTYIDILLRWNARINLTAVRQPEQIVTRHFGESLFAAHHLFPSARTTRGQLPSAVQAQPRLAPSVADLVPNSRVAAGLRPTQAEPSSPLPGGHSFSHAGQPAEKHQALAPEPNKQRPANIPRVIDVGSGAGFPGLPIKIYAPHVQLTLIESNQKKGAFLREVIRGLTLTNVDVFANRAERFLAQADVVTLRAVERFDAALPVAARLVIPSGRLALLIGQAQIGRARKLTPGFRWSDPLPIPLSSSRVLLIGSPGN
jgi:16S rRNA G527 N7-methylase RsmG